MKKKILIIGNSAKAYSLAKELSKENQIFIAPKYDTAKDFAESVDIREDSITELLEFVMENDIELTIPVSKKTLNTNIVELFSNNNQQIFAPNKSALNLVLDKALAKKCFYKLRIPTPKFGIFEKQNMAMDYIKNFKSPFVIKTNDDLSAVVLTSQITAKKIIDDIFAQNKKVIIEDYIWGTPFSFYIITDGYKALPIGSSIIYKHSLEGNGGQLTTGMGACSPNYKLSQENEDFLINDVTYPILEHLEQNETPYCGILAINGILTETNNVEILGLDTFMNDCDTDAILNLLDTDLISLMKSCIIGSFSDEVDFIPQKEISATSLVLKCNNKDNVENIIDGLELLNESTSLTFYPNIRKNKYFEFEAEFGSVLVLTTYASTVSSSARKAYEEAENIKFKGINFRKDICKPSFDNI